MMSRLLLIFFLATSLFLSSCAKESEHNLLDIYISWNDADLQLGQEEQLSIRCYPDDATLGLPQSSPIWSSQDTTVITIDSNGNIKAVGFGRSRIVVKWGGFKAEKYLVVNSEVKVDNPFLQSVLLEKYDANHDGKLYGAEIENVVGVDLSDLSFVTSPISFSGLEVFSKLTDLKISGVYIGYLDLSSFRFLRKLDISQSDIVRLDVHKCPLLRWLDCHDCPNLTELYIGDVNTYGPCALETIDCSRCNISSLDLSRCSLLEYLEYLDNPIDDVDLSYSPRLKVVNGQIVTQDTDTSNE
ncbi:MAG: hypothetical protein Q4C30_08355 [Bacteroidia bacterium]|nr:hypothetical protein [Bacteroidia bacterium]